MWRKVALAILVIVKLTALAAAPAQAAVGTDMAQVRAIVEPSIVYLDVTYEAKVWDDYYGQYVRSAPFRVSTSCTGFIVNPDGVLMTAGHCVDVDAEIRNALTNAAATWAYNNDYYQFDEGETRAQVNTWAQADFKTEDADGTRGNADVDVSAFQPMSQAGTTQWNEHRARILEVMEFGEGDLALLKVEAQNLPAIELAPEGTIDVGSEVITVGYAANVEAVADVVASPSYKDGTVSSERTLDGGLVPIYEVSAALSPGMSGGPAVDSEGRVVGVNSFRITAETQQFNFISPVRMVAEIMASRNVSNDLDDAAVGYREGVAALQAGDKAAALSGLQTAQKAWGPVAMVEDLIQDANALADPTPTTTSTTAPITDGATTATTTDDDAATPTGKSGGTSVTTSPVGGTTESNSGNAIVVALIGLALAAAAGTGIFVYRSRSAKPAASVTDPVGRLEQLRQLRDAGVISDDDFETAKTQAIAALTGVGV